MFKGLGLLKVSGIIRIVKIEVIEMLKITSNAAQVMRIWLLP